MQASISRRSQLTQRGQFLQPQQRRVARLGLGRLGPLLQRGHPECHLIGGQDLLAFDGQFTLAHVDDDQFHLRLLAKEGEFRADLVARRPAPV